MAELTNRWNDLTNTPTHLIEYGITDAMDIFHVANAITQDHMNHWNYAYNHALNPQIPLATTSKIGGIKLNGDSTTYLNGYGDWVEITAAEEYGTVTGVEWGSITGVIGYQTDLQSVLNTKATIASPTFTGTLTTPSLIVTDLTDGYLPYQLAATDKLGDSPVYTNGTYVSVGTTSQYNNRVFNVGTAGMYVNGNLEFPAGKNIFMGSTDDTGTRFKLGHASDESPTNICLDYYEDLRFRSGALSSIERARLTTEGYFGILTSTPLGALCVNGGVHIGGDSDAGDNNLLVDGTATITGASTFIGLIKTVGGVHIGGTSNPGTDNLIVDGTSLLTGAVSITGLAKQTSFTTGWAGTNWQIAAAGNAEFDNLIVRGSARFRELIIDQLSVIAGSQLLSVARGKVISIDTVNSKVTLDDPNATAACAFAANDFFWIKNIDIDQSLFTDVRGQITAVVGTTLTLNMAVAGANGAITDITVGDVIVQRGHPTNVDRQSLIYTTVSDTGAPFQRYMTDINSLAAFNTLANVSLQLGNLSTLDSHDIVPASPGIGMYSKNVYLSGTIQAISGETGGISIDADSIFTGTKVTGDGWSTDGLTIRDDGSIHTPNFYSDEDGEIGIRARVLVYSYIGVSDTVILSHDTEASTSGGPYVKLKTITLGAYLRANQTLRIKFDLRSSAIGVDAYGRIYRNGSAVGTERLADIEETFSQDITNWNAGDRIELYAHRGDVGTTAYVNDFRVCGEMAVAVNEVAGTNS